MAKVKCLYCGETFDREQESFYKKNRRYAHAKCALENGIPIEEIIDIKKTKLCPRCGERIELANDDKINRWKKVWWHKHCLDEFNASATDREKLEDYICSLFQWSFCRPNIKKQINEYIAKGMTPGDIHTTLIYFYEVEHGDKIRAKGGIGIVPYVYDKAKKYWLDIKRAQEVNKGLVAISQASEVNVSFKKKERTPLKKRKFVMEE